MRRKKTVFVLGAIPVLLGLWIGVMSWFHTQGRHKMLIPVEALQKTEIAWNSFEGVAVADSTRLDKIIRRVVASSEGFSKSQSDATIDLVRDVVVAYGGPDWGALERFRFPAPSYKIRAGSEQDLQTACQTPDVSSTNKIEQYRQVWIRTFEKPLWTEVFFFESSVRITNISSPDTASFSIPRFGPETNQSWMGSGRGALFEYPELEQSINLSRAGFTVLQLNLIGTVADGGRKERRPFMFLFYWDESLDRWIPWQFEQAYVRNPTHNILFF